MPIWTTVVNGSPVEPTILPECTDRAKSAALLALALVEGAQVALLVDDGLAEPAPGEVVQDHPMLARVHDLALGEELVLFDEALLLGELAQGREDRLRPPARRPSCK
jgi:hypothetical protein